MRSTDMKFGDRTQAAYQLADKLKEQRGKHPLILAIPRGAVPMAKVLSDQLEGELDLILVHKFGFPQYPEFALGSVTEEGDIYLGQGAESLGLKQSDIEHSALREIEKLRKKRELYTPRHKPADPKGRVVIIVDDGIATGATMTAAVRSLQLKDANRIIVATPVASSEAVRLLVDECAEVCAIDIPKDFLSVGQFYDDFSQVEDEEVIRIMGEEKNKKAGADPSRASAEPGNRI